MTPEQLRHFALLEQMAHGSYEGTRENPTASGPNAGNGAPDGRAAMLQVNGYDPFPQVVHGREGMEMVIYRPLRPGVAPVVTFRGSESVADWRTDLGDPEVGQRQYDANRELIEQQMALARSYAPDVPLEITGHSLGGGLAQMAAARNPDGVGSITTFQAPGVDQEDADRLNAENERRIANGQDPIGSDHFRVEGDIVPWAGDRHTPGTVHTLAIQQSEMGQMIDGQVRANLPLVSPAAGLVQAATGIDGDMVYEAHTSSPVTALALQNPENQAMLPGIRAANEGVRMVREEGADEAARRRPLNVGDYNGAELIRDGIALTETTAEVMAGDVNDVATGVRRGATNANAMTNDVIDGVQGANNAATRATNAGVDALQRQNDAQLAGANRAVDRAQQIAAPVMTPLGQLTVDAGQRVAGEGAALANQGVDAMQAGANHVARATNDAVDSVQRTASGVVASGTDAIDDAQRYAHRAWSWLHED